MITDLPDISLSDINAEFFRRGDFDFITTTPSGKHLKQEAALQTLTDKTTVELTYGGAAGGAKSWTGCAWLIFMCECYPGTKWFIGREELKRLRESTFITFYKAARYYGITDFSYNGQDHYFIFDNGSRIDLLDLKYLPGDPLYERYGSTEYTGGWIEEGGEVDFGAYDTLKSRVGRHLNDKYGLVRKLFVTCNPKKNWLYQYFWKPFLSGSLLPNQKFLQAFVDDNPFQESGYKEALQSIKDPVKRARLLEGLWEYDDDPSQLISFDAITDIFNNAQLLPGEGFITADIARFGADRTVIIRWNGWIAEQIRMLDHSAIDEVAAEITEIMKEHRIRISNVIVDDDGVGGGVKDILRCRGFVNNSRAVEVFNRGKEQFRNLKSQCYFYFATRVNERGVWVKSRVEKIRTMLIEELEQVKQKEVDSDKPKEIVAKEDVKKILGRSPDISDALMMREYFELQPKAKPRVTVT